MVGKHISYTYSAVVKPLEMEYPVMLVYLHSLIVRDVAPRSGDGSRMRGIRRKQ